MLTALKVIGLLSTSLPTLIKVIQYVLEAQKKFVENPDKKAWVSEQLKVVTKLNPDDIDRWIEGVLHLLQILGLVK